MSPGAPEVSPGSTAPDTVFGPRTPEDGRQLSRRSLSNAAFTGLVFASVVVAAIPLVAIVFYVLKKGSGVISVDFLTKDIPILTRSVGPGMGPAIVGTLLITGTATLMAVPLGILAAVYLNEYGKKNRLSTVIRTMSDVMTGVPSIVMGLFIYTVWVLRYGLSGFAGALALACLMLPIVIRSTEEILRLVPDGLREASLALGASRARTIVTVVLPAAISGITSGALLAVARAAGETAPLLFTVGASRKANWHVFSGANTALSTQIFRNAQQPFPGAQDRAWGAALTLIVLVVVLTIGARLITKRFAVPLR
ncbi:MAG: phosphate transport system permease protein [Actinomycetota bacterium]|nr:phosphate transport system permease protein [Actinomycetota bacterium]MDQ1505604.1 phosphate transport system permease protein [Actinomycetota bacterium]